jgi:hypothetical protein
MLNRKFKCRHNIATQHTNENPFCFQREIQGTSAETGGKKAGVSGLIGELNFVNPVLK